MTTTQKELLRAAVVQKVRADRALRRIRESIKTRRAFHKAQNYTTPPLGLNLTLS
jgi:hypothetical protein